MDFGRLQAMKKIGSARFPIGVGAVQRSSLQNLNIFVTLEVGRMIDKIANNEFNTESLNLNPVSEIREELDYYRSLFGRIHGLPDAEQLALRKDISKFFNLKPGGFTTQAPERLVRISKNNDILAAQGRPLSYLTDISQLLAPPAKYCNYSRCGLPGQQVLYCADSLAGAYWETKPTKGDVITISLFELLPGKTLNSALVKKEKMVDPKIDHPLREVYYLLEDFFVDIFSLVIDRHRPVDYLFSALLSSEQMFYPVVADNNVEAIIYPSVQKKKFSHNIAIRNDLVLERYKLLGVETRFILDEYEDIDPSTDKLTTDDVISYFQSTKFDFQKGKILYNEKADEVFDLMRTIQLSTGKQVRFPNPQNIKNLTFNLSPEGDFPAYRHPDPILISDGERVDVVYLNGERKDGVLFGKVRADVEQMRCRIIRY